VAISPSGVPVLKLKESAGRFAAKPVAMAQTRNSFGVERTICIEPPVRILTREQPEHNAPSMKIG
jgi:hypothetical protein